MKMRKEVVYSDEMVELHKAQAEFSDADLARRFALSNRKEGPDGVRYNQFDLDLAEACDEFLAGGPVKTVAENLVLEAETELPKLGLPERRQKIWARLYEIRLSDGRKSAEWEPAVGAWKQKDPTVKPGWIGTFGENYWLGKMDCNPYSKQWKLTNLYSAATNFLSETDPTKRENLAFRLGDLRERIRLHDAHLNDVKKSKRQLNGVRKAAQRTNDMKGELTTKRRQLMGILIKDKGFSISEAARRLERQGLGTFEANRKLYRRG